MSVRLPFKGVMPEVAASAFVAPNTSLIGDVVVAIGHPRKQQQSAV